MIAYQSAHLSGIYLALRRLCEHFCPDLAPLPEYEELGSEYIHDLVALLIYDDARRPKPR